MSAPITEPEPGGTCRVCQSQLGEGSLRCIVCGAVYGEANRCPHCRSVTDVEPSALLGVRCRVCGGPRVPLDDPEAVRSGRELALLHKAERLRIRQALFLTAGAVVSGFGILSLVVTALVLAIVSPGALPAVLAVLLASLPALSGALLLWHARRKRAELRRELGQAWTIVAADLVRSRKSEIDARELGKTMRIDVPRADALLSELHAHDWLHAHVTNDGNVVYSTSERLRVDELDPASPEEATTNEHARRSGAQR